MGFASDHDPVEVEGRARAELSSAVVASVPTSAVVLPVLPRAGDTS